VLLLLQYRYHEADKKHKKDIRRYWIWIGVGGRGGIALFPCELIESEE